ncbi:MAG: hypothetical protein JXB23_12160 [Candidatus Aminicenantes bacterium]|nr:hypothetical protein [Candidatus Aminicenantes bacterium]
MKTKIGFLVVISLVFFIAITSSCTRKAVEAPSPVGPSTYSVVLDANASPNVIIAGNSRDTVNVSVTVSNFEGIPLANETILFEILDPDTGKIANIGYFEGNKSQVTRVTDSSGGAGVLYYGPINEELIEYVPPEDNKTDVPIPEPPDRVYIRASLAWQGNQFIYDYAPLEIITDNNTLEFRLRADPNVLWIQGGSEQSTLTASLKRLEGPPISGRRVLFTFISGPGQFKNGKKTAIVTTNASGEAKIVYVSPNRNQISSDGILVRIQAQLETEDPNWAHAEADIRLFRGN